MSDATRLWGSPLDHAQSLLNSFCSKALLSFQADSQHQVRLFHYTSEMGMYGILGSGKLRAHDVGTMNDFIELSYAGSVMSAHIERCLGHEQIEAACPLYEELRQYIKSIAISNIFVISFSDMGENPDLWRLYAQRGKGYSFALKHADMRSWDGFLCKCQYDPNDLNAFCLGALMTLRDAYLNDLLASRAGPVQAYVHLFFQKVGWFAPIFKHPVWKDEREWRIVFLRPGGSGVTSDGQKRFLEMPPETGRLPIEAICAGPKCGSAVELQQQMAPNGYDNVPLHRSEAMI